MDFFLPPTLDAFVVFLDILPHSFAIVLLIVVDLLSLSYCHGHVTLSVPI